jgi:protein gp37
LDAPKNTLLPEIAKSDIGYKNVFVCSMADLFGSWVPEDWISSVLKAVEESPQWNFLFLTKNPERLIDISWPENAWVGTTVDVQSRVARAEEAFRRIEAPIKFISCEPLRERLDFNDLSMFNWMIIGGQSASTKLPEFQPEWDWVASLVMKARDSHLKIYLKPNLRPARLREYPKNKEAIQD